MTSPCLLQDVTVTVSPTTGDPDLYVNLNGEPASKSNWTYRSIGASGADSVVISQAMTGCKYNTVQQCTCADCDIMIAVTPFGGDATYTIVVSTSTSIVTLMDARPIREIVSSTQYEQFRFESTMSNAILTVSLTALSGDPDLTIALTPNPSRQNGTWKSIAWGSDIITIPSTVIGTYYISVFGFTSSSFALTAHLQSDNTSVQLSPGVPHIGFTVATEYDYYRLPVGDKANLTFLVTNLAGSVTMVINPCTTSGFDMCRPVYPTLSNKTWSTTSSASGQLIRISASDSHACEACVYIIGVYSNDAPANYTILVSDNTGTLLVRGHCTVPPVAPRNAPAHTPLAALACHPCVLCTARVHAAAHLTLSWCCPCLC
jgi:hypothetical protein